MSLQCRGSPYSAGDGGKWCIAEAYPDPYQWDRKSKYYDAKSAKENPRWSTVDVEFVERLPAMVSLDTMKTAKGLEEMVVIKRGRLSVQPVTAMEFEIVRRLANT